MGIILFKERSLQSSVSPAKTKTGEKKKKETQGPDQESVTSLLMSTHTNVRAQFSQHVSHLAQAILISFKGRDGHPQTRVCSTQAHSAGTRL